MYLLHYSVNYCSMIILYSMYYVFFTVSKHSDFFTKNSAVYFFCEFESVTLVQREHRRRFNENSPHKTIFIVDINCLRSRKGYKKESVLVGYLSATNQLNTLKIVSFSVIRNQFASIFKVLRSVCVLVVINFSCYCLIRCDHQITAKETSLLLML